ncbi:ATG12 [Auxenochlorella protothecoides x Auxenochlorella symbiontica]
MSDGKVVILFKQTGDAPVLKQAKVKVDGQERFSKLVEFLRKKLGKDQVFLYLKEAFSPSLEERISVLYEAFGVDGRLVTCSGRRRRGLPSQMPRFFFLTTSKADNLRASVARGGWACAPGVAARLVDALQGPEPVLVFLSARPTGNFAGMGRLASPPLPGQTVPWEGDRDLAPPCALEWFFRHDVPFAEAEHIRNMMDDGRPVRSGKNGQEVDPAAGAALAALLEGAARAAGAAAPPLPSAPLSLGPRPAMPGPMVGPPGQMMMNPMLAAAMGGFAAPGMMMHPAMAAMQGMGMPPGMLVPGAMNPMLAGVWPGMGRPGQVRPTPPPPAHLQAPGGGGGGGGSGGGAWDNNASRGEGPGGRATPDDRPDIMYMSYDEYVETFESLKGQDKAKEGKAASGTEEEAEKPKAVQSAQLMSEEDYLEHCRKFTAEMGLPFDEAVVRQHYHNMKATVAADAVAAA